MKMTLTLSPRGSKFWKDSLRGTALELKNEHDYKGQKKKTRASVDSRTQINKELKDII